MKKTPAVQTIQLPAPRERSSTSVEEAFLKRRSTREYAELPVTLAAVGQLLWAAQGINDRRRGLRTAPSAGALYPLEVYLVSGNVEGLPGGVYRYNPRTHELLTIHNRDIRDQLSRAAVGQQWIGDAPAVVVIAAVVERTAARYGNRAPQYVHMEAGHAAQNVSLQAVALGLGTVVVGAFYDEEVRKIVGIAESEVPLCLMPVGRLRTSR